MIRIASSGGNQMFEIAPFFHTDPGEPFGSTNYTITHNLNSRKVETSLQWINFGLYPDGEWGRMTDQWNSFAAPGYTRGYDMQTLDANSINLTIYRLTNNNTYVRGFVTKLG